MSNARTSSAESLAVMNIETRATPASSMPAAYRMKTARGWSIPSASNRWCM